MDQLGLKIKQAIETHFQVKLISFDLSRDADMWGLHFGGSSLTYKVKLTLVESKHKLSTNEYPAHTMQNIMRDEIFNKILGESGKLISMSTNMDHSTYKTELQFVTHDIIGFTNALHDFGWKTYSKEFDQLIDSTLKD